MTKERRAGHTLADAIDIYVSESEGQMGRTRAQVLTAIKQYDIGGKSCDDIRSQEIVAFAQQLLAGGRQPQTVSNDLSHLSAIFGIAKPAWGMDLRPPEMAAAMVVCKRLGLTAKARSGDRRPTLAEMDLPMDHIAAKHASGRAMPKLVICAFATFSTRRQQEITRIRWAEPEPGRVLGRDMKHPGQKIGNDQWVELPPEAERILRAMPQLKAQIFPYSTLLGVPGYDRHLHLAAIP